MLGVLYRAYIPYIHTYVHIGRLSLLSPLGSVWPGPARQALLLALGIKAKRLGAAAAMSWVLKDALGKFGRILWASKMGRRFDSDAKRWRFRSRYV